MYSHGCRWDACRGIDKESTGAPMAVKSCDYAARTCYGQRHSQQSGEALGRKRETVSCVPHLLSPGKKWENWTSGASALPVTVSMLLSLSTLSLSLRERNKGPTASNCADGNLSEPSAQHEDKVDKQDRRRYITVVNIGRVVPTAAIGTAYSRWHSFFLRITIKSTPSIQQYPLKRELCTIFREKSIMIRHVISMCAT
jgi:hypothetical protein